MSHQLRSRYDVVINGGGIVGFTLLNLILKSPHLSGAKVLLIEQAKKPSSFDQISRSSNGLEDKTFLNRVSSINYKSKSTFKRLGVWDTVRPFSKGIKKIKAWNYDFRHNITFDQHQPDCQKGDKEEQDILFSTVENNRLSLALLDNIHKCHNSTASIAWSSKLVNLEESLDQSGLVDVTISNSDENCFNITAPLILACDGYKSKIRELTKMDYRECDLKETAVVGTVRMTQQMKNRENNIAYQRFSFDKDTIAALLPLDNDYSSFVISAPNDYASYLLGCDEETFIEEFNQLLSTKECPKDPVFNWFNEALNKGCDVFRQVHRIDMDGSHEVPNVERVVTNSRASFPLSFGTTSPRMITSLPNLSRLQIAFLGDASHRVHPLAGQGLNLGIHDAIDLVKQIEAIAKTGERIFHDPTLISKALRLYQIQRQAYLLPMSISILVMKNLFRWTPSCYLSTLDLLRPVKRSFVRFANCS